MLDALYSKLKADLLVSIAGGGLTAAVLYLIDASGAEVDPTLKATLIGALGWVSGKIAAYFKTELGPKGITLTARPEGSPPPPA